MAEMLHTNFCIYRRIPLIDGKVEEETESQQHGIEDRCGVSLSNME